MADATRTERELESTWAPGTSVRTMTSTEKWVVPEQVTNATTPSNFDSRYFIYTWNGTSVINTAKALGSYTCTAGYTYKFKSDVCAVNGTGQKYAYFSKTYFCRVNATGTLVINGTATALSNGTQRSNGTFTMVHAVNGTTKVLSHTCTGPATAGGSFFWYGRTEVFRYKRTTGG
jgi:hypothetical protein